jgi:hypothetical protein
MLDADGDGDLSFKELKQWLEDSEDKRTITFRAFNAALQELGFGELREQMLKNIYVACVNDGPRGQIEFGRMYEGAFVFLVVCMYRVCCSDSLRISPLACSTARHGRAWSAKQRTHRLGPGR